MSGMVGFLFIMAAVLAAGNWGLYLYMRRLAERRIMRYQDDLTKKHCAEVDNLYRQTRGWRHDIKNHLQTMLAYLEMGQIKQAEQYIRELTDNYNEIDFILKTGNTMVDAVLNSKLNMLKAKEIKVDATASVPRSVPVSDVDLSIMIGNLLDNAMEACMKLAPERRFVRFYMTEVKENLYIYIMNSADGKYRRKAGSYLSTKESDSHGYGILRIDRVVKKYGGYQNREDEGDVFATEILLPL